MEAAILTIGEEILIGQIVDTNSAWIAQELNKIGISVKKIISISDSDSEIQSAVNQLLNNYDIVLSTGGLGPTSDDITKQSLCKVFGSKLVLHNETLDHVREIFEKRGLPLTEINSKQAELPDNCEVLYNSMGTAPGMLFHRDGRYFISMPGVPFEMKAIMEKHVIPRFRNNEGGEEIVHKTIHTYGLPESFLAEKISDWESNLPNNIKLAYLPSPLSIRLRLSSKGFNRHIIDVEIQDQIEKLLRIIPENIFGYDNDTLASVVGRLLTDNGLTLSTAESCTGGTLSQLITQVPGSSNYFLGGIISYSNLIKINELGVRKELIEEHGAVSQQVVEAMAEGIKNRFGSHYSIATSGIAGPTGGTPLKPVGTVWVAISSMHGTISQQFIFGSDRERNILRSSASALNMLRIQIEREKNKKSR